MIAQFVIPGRFPSLNEYISAERANKYAAASMKRKHTDRVAELIVAKNVPTFHDPVELYLAWFEPNRRRDPDNIRFAAKFVLDGMVRAGIIPNDTQRWVRGITDEFYTDKDRPRVLVVVSTKEG